MNPQISPAINDNISVQEHIDFSNHLKAMISHAAKKAQISESSAEAFYGYMEEHMFVNRKFHHYLTHTIHTLKEHNAKTTQHLINHLHEQCTRVLSSQELAEHHEDARQLLLIIEEQRREVESIITRNERDSQEYRINAEAFYPHLTEAKQGEIMQKVLPMVFPIAA